MSVSAVSPGAGLACHAEDLCFNFCFAGSRIYGPANIDNFLKQVPQFSSRSFMDNLLDCGDRSRLPRASTSGKHTQDLPSDGFFLVTILAFMMQDLS
jgi:hypothetical protein